MFYLVGRSDPLGEEKKKSKRNPYFVAVSH